MKVCKRKWNLISKWGWEGGGRIIEVLLQRLFFLQASSQYTFWLSRQISVLEYKFILFVFDCFITECNLKQSMKGYMEEGIWELKIEVENNRDSEKNSVLMKKACRSLFLFRVIRKSWPKLRPRTKSKSF